ncbi:thioredoxin family protein [Bacillus tropicus]|nr:MULTISPECIES: thioredoxin family protein [Bacillus]
MDSEKGETNMKEIKSDKEFKDIIASEEPVVVKFFTTWCPDCVRMDNFIGDVMEEFNKFEWYSINKDEFPSIAEEYQVMGIPSLLVYQNGEKLGHLHSANAKTEEQVTEFLEAY